VKTSKKTQNARNVAEAIETLAPLGVPSPSVTDDIDGWLTPRTVNTLRAHGIRTLADLTVRVPRRRCWWAGIAGLGASGARQVEAFFSASGPHGTGPHVGASGHPFMREHDEIGIAECGYNETSN